MKKIYRYMAVLLLGVSTVSCEGFLEKDPDGAIPKEDVLQSPDDMEPYIMGVYSAFKNSALYSGTLTLAPDIQADLMYAVNGYSNQYGDIWRWNINSTTGEIASVYSGLYLVISRANFFLDRVPQLEALGLTEDEQELLEKCEGDCYMARALAYSELLKIYCKAYDPATADKELGMSMIMTYDESAMEVPRESLKRSYEMVLEDLARAEKLVTRDVSNSIYFTIGAVNALYARTYLYMQNWEKAAEYATKVIDNSIYSLASGVLASDSDSSLSQYQYMWYYDTSSEVIWKVAFTATSAGGSLSSIFHHYNYTSMPYMPDYVPAQWLLDLYDTMNDTRYATFFSQQQTGYSHGLTWPLFIGKYWSNPTLNATTSESFLNEPKVFRLSEQYLIRAEAYAELGEDELAAADLTTLRKARITGYTEYLGTGEDLMQEIRTERVKELCMEGFRLQDLKRWHEGFARTPQDDTIDGTTANALQVDADDALFVWPIPQHELEAYPDLQPNDSNKK